MNKRIAWVGIGVIVVVAAIILALVHKSSNSPASSSSNKTSSNTSANAPNQPAAASIITTKTDPTNGEFLAASNGKPLYTYGGDTTGVSNCTGSCLTDWPIYGPVSSSASLPANVTIITRSDGKVQYAYKGMPLYYFSGDTGSTPTGNNVGNFHLAKP